MKITVLGCGASDGVPQIGCDCAVCISSDSKNKRTRAAILIEIKGFRILVDAGPDLRQQLLREDITSLDAVLITHAHFDHMAGMGDLKRLVKNNTLPLFADDFTLQLLRTSFSYAFRGSKLHPAILEACPFFGSFSLPDIKLQVIPFKQKHGSVFSHGFRLGDFAYSTDVSHLSDEAYGVLEGVPVWVVDCIRYCPSLTHFCLDDTIAAILRVKPERAILTHMCHDIDYNLLSKLLPRHIVLAYDGMKFEISYS